MRIVAAVLLWCAIATPQGARIFIVTDLEGVGGINGNPASRRDTSGPWHAKHR